jgi:hypothetical protein
MSVLLENTADSLILDSKKFSIRNSHCNELFSYLKWWTHFLPLPELQNRLINYDQTWYDCSGWSTREPEQLLPKKGVSINEVIIENLSLNHKRPKISKKSYCL